MEGVDRSEELESDFVLEFGCNSGGLQSTIHVKYIKIILVNKSIYTEYTDYLYLFSCIVSHRERHRAMFVFTPLCILSTVCVLYMSHAKRETTVVQEEYTYVPKVDLESYVGKWYQVYGDAVNAAFEGLKPRCVEAEYALMNDGNISVKNSELGRNGTVQTIEGVAFYGEDAEVGTGDLSVSFYGIPGSMPVGTYWIIKLGPIVDEYYDYAVVSDDKQVSLFVLARDVERYDERYDEDVLQWLAVSGFTRIYNEPIRTDQEGCI